jgi:MFS family permease
MFQVAMCVHALHAFIIPFLQPLAKQCVTHTRPHHSLNRLATALIFLSLLCVCRNWAGFWVLLIFLFVLRGAAMAAAYTGSALLLNNCTTDSRAGAVFGMVESFAALGQCCGPLVGSVLLAWSENNGGRQSNRC